MLGKPIADIIDDMLAAPKDLGGQPAWVPFRYGRDEQERLLVPLLINGESTGIEMLAIAYPNEKVKKYRILLNAPKCIWRVDHVFDEPHVNSLSKPASLTDFSFTCPHYHAWADNRHFATHAALPSELPNARILPGMSFDSTLRWFCAQVNIHSPPAGLIDFPQRKSLL